jgi:hypothetical protein
MSDFNKTGIFSTDLTKTSNINICPVGADLFHADGQTDRQTDMTKLIVPFRNFAKAPRKGVDMEMCPTEKY